MSTRQETVDFLLEQLGAVHGISARKMFGEYALYVGPKVVALICDDQLFLKPTNAGRALIGAPVDGFAYPGAKASFLIVGEFWDDADWLCDLVRRTESEVPMPKPKKAKKT
jgi:DNA transformation protein and related proteins